MTTHPGRHDLVEALRAAREANRKLHRRCQQAERLHSLTHDMLKRWSDYVKEFEPKTQRNPRHAGVYLRLAMRELTKAADRAALASEAASQVPADGWHPGEVTQTMIDAGEEARLAHTDIYMDGSEVAGAGIIEAIYHAMIAAAPDQEGPADGK